MKPGLRFGIGLAVAAVAWGQPTVSSVTNVYYNASGVVAPGGEVFVNGAKLAASVQNCLSGSQYLTNCNGTSVSIGGYAAAIQQETPSQLTVYIPYEISGGTVSLTVTTGQGTSTGFSLTVVPALPGVSFIYDNSVSVTAQNPAHAGDTVFVFATGLGVTSPALSDGQVPSGSSYQTAGILQVTVGGIPVVVSTPTESEIDLYGLAFQVPSGLSGNQPVVLTMDGVSSAPATLQLSGSPSALSVTTPPNLGTFSIGEVQVALSAAGGNGSYTWTLQSGSLPPGLEIRGDLPLYVSPWAPSALIGVATTPGTYNFTLAVASGSVNTTASFTMKITSLVLRGGPTLPDAFVGVAYDGTGYQLTASANDSPALVTCTAYTNMGLTLNDQCLISGSPTTAGPLTIPVTFSSGIDTVSQSVNLMVYPVQIGSPGQLTNATLNQPYSYTISIFGKGPFTYGLSGSLPAGLSWAGPVISGTPTGPLGKTNFSFQATDANGNLYQKSLSIDVVGTPEPLPQLSPYADQTDCTIGVGCTQAIAVTSGTAPFAWSATGLPPGMTLRYGPGTLAYVSGGDLELWGAPTELGTFPVTVTAIDINGLSVTQVFPINVSPLLFDTCGNQAGCPVLANGQVGMPYAGVFRLVGGTPPYHSRLNASAIEPRGLPPGLAVSDTAISGISDESGQFFPTLHFSDSAANTLTIPLPLTISAGGSTTVAYFPTLPATVGQSFSVQLSACCASRSYSWSAPLRPSWLTLSSSGVLSGVPPQAETYYAVVQATDSGNPSNYGLRELVIDSTGISIATNVLPPGVVGLAYGRSLYGTGNGSLFWGTTYAALLPPGLSLNSSGTIAGTPADPGAYSFTVYAVDSTGSSVAKTVSLSVFTQCDLEQTGITNASDVREILSESLGQGLPPMNDLNGDQRLTVVDIQIAANAALGRGCSAQ